MSYDALVTYDEVWGSFVRALVWKKDRAVASRNSKGKCPCGLSAAQITGQSASPDTKDILLYEGWFSFRREKLFSNTKV